MSTHYDAIVVGGGPAGGSAAWRLATHGANVLLCDRALFPRDKPCGDGITPRAVMWLTELGLAKELERFHRVDRIRVIADIGTAERPWPNRPGLPRHGYVIPRTQLDHLILGRAAEAGADVQTGVRVSHVIQEGGRVVGVTGTRDRREFIARAPLTIAADGMSSPTVRSAGLPARKNPLYSMAVRAQIPSQRADDATLEFFVNLHYGDDLLPGYGWVFPMGDGQLNIGVGYMTSYPGWNKININALMDQFVRSLPDHWELGNVAGMVREKKLQGWKLPLGLVVWPPWKPGLLGVGDAIGAAKPFTGSGISKALQSGVIGADVALATLAHGDPADLKAYETEIDRLWGRFYRLGRLFSAGISRPSILTAVSAALFRYKALREPFVRISTGNGWVQDRPPRTPVRLSTEVGNGEDAGPSNGAGAGPSNGEDPGPSIVSELVDLD